MNAISSPAAQPATVIAIHDPEPFLKHAVGSIVFWSLSKEPIQLSALVAALTSEGSSATPPEPPSDIVALHRACLAVAKILKLDLHGRERGKWALVSRPTLEGEGSDHQKLAYPVEATAELRDDGALNLTGSDRFLELLAAEYGTQRGVIASQDIGSWLCRKLQALDAVSLRPTGGFYFLPQPSVGKWEKLTRALKKVSKHSVFSLPAMKSAGAVEAILQAITNDTETACEKIGEEIPTAGKRALEARQKTTEELLARASKYESLLGMKLEGLREVLNKTRQAVATAMLMASSGDETS